MSKKVKTCIVVFSLAACLVSLTQTAFTVDDFDGERAYSSISLLLMGSIAFLGGGLFEWMIWLANPLYVLGLLLFFYRGTGVKCSIAATVLALSFMTWKEVLAAENGRTAEIVCLNAGYWLWLTGLAVSTAGGLGFAVFTKKI